MSTELIAAWVYKKGELTKQKMDNWILGIAVVISLLLTFTVAWPFTYTHIPFSGKIDTLLLLLVFFGCAVIVYYGLRLFSGSLFTLYTKIAGIEEEEILFTNKRIATANKIWALNSDTKKLTAVSFARSKNSALIFKVTETKPGKNPVSHTIKIPVPLGELRNAAKVYVYFKNVLV